VLGPCVGNGNTTLAEVNAQLAKDGFAGAWKYSSDDFTIRAGTAIQVTTTGGELHTFTGVAAFGGGCVAGINTLIGLTPVPECANFGALVASTGARPGQTFTVTPQARGTLRFQCLIHPWMRTTVTVR
jgi:plastocyanin